jgi:hypothetical protein
MSIPQFRWYELALQLGKDDRDEVMETKDPASPSVAAHFC